MKQGSPEKCASVQLQHTLAASAGLDSVYVRVHSHGAGGIPSALPVSTFTCAAVFRYALSPGLLFVHLNNEQEYAY